MPQLSRQRSIAGASSGGGGATPVASFPYDVAVYSGQFLDGVSPYHYRQFHGLQSTAELVVVGSQLVIKCQSAFAGNSEAQIDGGSWADIEPTAYGTQSSAVVFSGLSDAAHTVVIRGKGAGLFYVDKSNPGSFVVTGANPAAYKTAFSLGSLQFPTNATGIDDGGRIGILNNLRCEIGYTPRTIVSPEYDLIGSLNLLLASDDSESVYPYGMQFRFNGSCGQVEIFTFLDGAKFALIVDGTAQPVVATPALAAWGWVTLATGLDTSTAHVYGVLCAFWSPADFSFGSNTVVAVRTNGGAGVDFTSRPAVRDAIAFFGDSITANSINLVTLDSADPTNNDATQGWIYLCAEALDMQSANLGIGASMVRDYTGHTVGYTGDMRLVTVLNGQARTNNVAELSPAPTKVVVLYGTNDMVCPFTANGLVQSTTTEFQTAYEAMLAGLVGGLPGTTKIYCLGLLPRSDVSSGTLATWNGVIQAAITANGATNLQYVDTSGWQLNGVSGTDYVTNYIDGLHPNYLGHAIMATNLTPILAA